MRWDCDRRARARREVYRRTFKEWSPCFAWRPVRLIAAESLCVWLEHVERRRMDDGGYVAPYWIYRTPA